MNEEKKHRQNISLPLNILVWGKCRHSCEQGHYSGIVILSGDIQKRIKQYFAMHLVRGILNKEEKALQETREKNQPSRRENFGTNKNSPKVMCFFFLSIIVSILLNSIFPKNFEKLVDREFGLYNSISQGDLPVFGFIITSAIFQRLVTYIYRIRTHIRQVLFSLFNQTPKNIQD